VDPAFQAFVCENGYVFSNESRAIFKATKRNAKRGDRDAQTCVAICYLFGCGAIQNAAKAIAWFRKAAAQGDADAFVWLGQIYASGAGVETDIEYAEKCFLRAANLIASASH
jgi:hypothetical protein